MNQALSLFADEPRIFDMPKRAEVKIMLVEDNTSDALLTRIALDGTQIPYTLTRIPRGDEVLPKLLNITSVAMPDLILLDLGLPGMDGFELMETMMRMPNFLRAVPIAILTAYKDFDYLDKNYPLLIMDYIQKPCTIEAMRSMLLRLNCQEQPEVQPA